VIPRLHGRLLGAELTLVALAAVPLALSLRKVKLGGGAPAGH